MCNELLNKVSVFKNELDQLLCGNCFLSISKNASTNNITRNEANNNNFYDLTAEKNRSFLIYDYCSSCKRLVYEGEGCTKVWSNYFCQTCWNCLQCGGGCGQRLNKAKVFKGKKDRVLCENCFSSSNFNKLNANTRNGEKLESFEIDECSCGLMGPKITDVTCFICGIKYAGNGGMSDDVSVKKWRVLWNNCYCEGCWQSLKKCQNQIERKIEKGEVVCRNCAIGGQVQYFGSEITQAKNKSSMCIIH